MALKTGIKAPDIRLKSTSGNEFSLEDDMQGTSCIIYFYPKNFTPGCTEEACSFRDAFSEFRNLNIPIFGISRDSIESHIKFKKAHNLPFELLSDPTGKVCKAYDAFIPVLRIPKRITYLLDEKHQIIAAYQDMFAARSHIEQMIKKSKDANN
ncbi:MAG: peroxiredoxin [Roseivirga sp.]|nr:peroxiredoxin [Roseivirga sp.]